MRAAEDLLDDVTHAEVDGAFAQTGVSLPPGASEASVRAIADDVEPGSLIAGRYRVESELGRGGMGGVFAAVHTVTGQRVAVKVMMGRFAEDGLLVARFMREAKTASSVDHPNAIRIHDVATDEHGAPYMVMEMLEGRSLDEQLELAGCLSVGEVARVFVPVLHALAHAHARGVVHRDLKPDNVFLAVMNGETVPKVLDFGIAKVIKDGDVDAHTMKLTSTGMMLGTPFYMSPEQASGRSDLDHRSDIWSLGVVLYEALTGVRPFEGTNFGQLFASILQQRPVPVRELEPGVPADVAELVERCLEKDPGDRPADATELARVLSPYADLPAVELPKPRASRPSSTDPTAPTVASSPSMEARIESGSGGMDVGAEVGISSVRLLEPVASPSTVARPPSRVAAFVALAALTLAGLGAFGWWYSSSTPPTLPVERPSAQPPALDEAPSIPDLEPAPDEHDEDLAEVEPVAAADDEVDDLAEPSAADDDGAPAVDAPARDRVARRAEARRAARAGATEPATPPAGASPSPRAARGLFEDF